MTHTSYHKCNPQHRFAILFLFLFALFAFSGKLNAENVGETSGNATESTAAAARTFGDQ